VVADNACVLPVMSPKISAISSNVMLVAVFPMVASFWKSPRKMRMMLVIYIHAVSMM